MAKDYYKILGVTEEAGQLEIKKAYRQQALELHPDVNPSVEAATLYQQVKEAYEILGDEEARRHYDSGTVIIDFTDFEEPRQYPYAPAKPKPTNFALYAKQSTRVCVMALVFSLTFFLDLFVQQDLGNVEVEYSEVTGYKANNDGQYLMYVKTDAGSFNTTAKGRSIYIGEYIQMKKGYIYGFIRYKRASDPGFQLTNENPAIIFIIAGLVLISGIFGLIRFPFISHERKLNAAIIGGFFSSVLLIFLLAT